jgi:hypothetical protein
MHRWLKVSVLLAVAMTVACTSQLEPAQKMLGDVTATMAEVSADASAMVPEKYAEVQRQIDELHARFDHEDYAAVIAQGPALLAAVHGLGLEAAASKVTLAQQLNAGWARRASGLPEEFAAIERQLDFLAKPANRKAAAGIDVSAARNAEREAVSLWSKGQGAYAAGNLPEAVQTADAVQARADAIKAAIHLR